MKRLILSVILGTIFTFMIGCKSRIIEVPIKDVITEIEIIERLQRDSIFMLDSVFVDRYKSNDTIYLTKEKYKYIYKDKVRVDSVDKIITEYKDVIVEVEVEKDVYPKWLIILAIIGAALATWKLSTIVRHFI